jgi:hypothetical protein
LGRKNLRRRRCGLRLGRHDRGDGRDVCISHISTCHIICSSPIWAQGRDDGDGERGKDALPRVVVVQYDFHNFVLSKDESVCVTAVDDRVCSVGAGGKDGVQGGYFGADISNIVEEGTGLH